MKLFVDNREKKERINNCQKYFKGKLHVENGTLKYGDYLFSNNNHSKEVVFEFKTISDFMNSAKDGSVFEEVVNQTIAYDHSYIIIVGNVENYCKEMWKIYKVRQKWGKYYNYINYNLKVFSGAFNKLLTICPVIQVYDEDDSFGVMFDVSDKIINNDNNFVFGSKRRLKDNNKLVGLLSNILGKKTSELIVDELELKCLYDLLNISKDDLLGIKGIGDKKATDIMKFIYDN